MACLGVLDRLKAAVLCLCFLSFIIASLPSEFAIFALLIQSAVSTKIYTINAVANAAGSHDVDTSPFNFLHPPYKFLGSGAHVEEFGPFCRAPRVALSYPLVSRNEAFIHKRGNVVIHPFRSSTIFNEGDCLTARGMMALRRYHQTVEHKTSEYWKRVPRSINELALPYEKKERRINVAPGGSSLVSKAIKVEAELASQHERKNPLGTKNSYIFGKFVNRRLSPSRPMDLLKFLANINCVLLSMMEAFYRYENLRLFTSCGPNEKVTLSEEDIMQLSKLVELEPPQPGSEALEYVQYIMDIAESNQPAFLAHVYGFHKEWALNGGRMLNEALRALQLPVSLRMSRWEPDVLNLEVSLNKFASSWGDYETSRFLEELPKVKERSTPLVEPLFTSHEYGG